MPLPSHFPLPSLPNSHPPVLSPSQAIIALADFVKAQLDVAFSTGGNPVLIESKGDQFTANFVIATTDFDSGGGDVPKREKSQSRAAPSKQAATASKGRSNTPSNAVADPSRPMHRPPTTSHQAKSKNTPLFNPPSPSQQDGEGEGGGGHDKFQFPQPGEGEEDEFGDLELDFGAADYAAIDRLSQLPPVGAGAGTQKATFLVPATTSAVRGSGEGDGGMGGAMEGGEEDEELEYVDGEGEGAGEQRWEVSMPPPTQVGPTPRTPRPQAEVRRVHISTLSLFSFWRMS